MARKLIIEGPVESNLKELTQLVCGIDLTTVDRLATAIAERATGESVIYLFGNGGSAAIAEHFALDLERIANDNRRRVQIRPLSLVGSSVRLTADANDYGFDHVFSRQLEAYLKPNDIAVGITASGASGNVVEALRVAHERQVFTVVLTRADETPADSWCDLSLKIPATVPALLETVFSCALYLVSERIRAILANAAVA